ncbi:MAG: hypothetical protein GTO15_10995 [Pseudomonas stutzeri]|nr:hypothetical protein [Stutzerimonas stutzeri]
MSEVDWMAMPGMKILPTERQLLYDLAAEVCARFGDETVIVNIGVARGASLHCLYAGAPEARHVAVDIDLGRYPCVNKDALEGVEFVQADSNLYGLEFEAPVHLLFVDGCHEFHVVSTDILAWLPHIPVGGVAAFHDYNPSPEDLARLGAKLRGVRWAVRRWYVLAQGWAWHDVVGSIIVFRRVR